MPIRTKDGHKIWISEYLPEKGNDKVIIIAAAGALTRESYDPVAYFFQQHDFTVVTFDYRGMGSSAPTKLKGYAASMHQWAVQDIDAVILFAKNKFPKQEIIYIGHCTGGEIVGLAQASQYINRLVLISSSLSCKKLLTFKNRIRIEAIGLTISVMSKLFGYFPGRRVGFGSDMPKGVLHEWINWCDNSNGLFDFYPDHNYRKLQVPILAFSFSDDWHCPPTAVQELLSRFSNAEITWHHLKPEEIGINKVGHYGFFDPLMKTILWIKMLRWLNEDDCKNKRSKIIQH